MSEKRATTSNGKSGYRFSFAEIDITPQIASNAPVRLQGFAGPERPANRATTSQKLQFLLLQDVNLARVLILSADLFGFDAPTVEAIRSLAGGWGIPPEGLLISTSHTHNAAGTHGRVNCQLGPYYQDYVNQIVQMTAQVLPALEGRLEESELWFGRTEARIGVNRRRRENGNIVFGVQPDGRYEEHTPFLVINGRVSGRRIVVVNHGCHLTGVTAENVLSADYPAYMRDELQKPGRFHGVMFLQGASGDIKEAIYQNGQVRFAEKSIDAEANGRLLAQRVWDAQEKGLKKIEGPIFCTRKTALLPLIPQPPPEALRLVATQGPNPLVRAWATEVLKQPSPNGKAQALPMEIQLMCLGDDVKFFALPAEPTAALGAGIREQAENPDQVFVCGCANGLTTYLPTDEQIAEKGYEVEGSPLVYLLPGPLQPGVEGLVYSACQKVLDEFGQTDKATGYGRYYLEKEPRRAFFTLSAGRCGTKSLAHLLDTASNARVWHHPQPFLINETLAAYRGEIDAEKVFWEARARFLCNSWAEGLIHGETDLNMTPFAETIASELPESRFIILVRDPRNFVRSGVRRNYYQGHPWDSGRLRPKENTAEYEEWNKLDQFEKVCWLWAETYRRIEKIAEAIGRSRVLTIRFEDLMSGTETVEETFRFLGLEGFDPDRIVKALRVKHNAQTTGDFPRPKDWAPELHEKLWKICGPMAEIYGYQPFTPIQKAESSEQQERVVFHDHARPKVLFLESPNISTGGHLDHVIPALRSDFEAKHVKTLDVREIESLVKWADIVWLEWANEMAIHVTTKVPVISDKKVICRLIGYETFTALPSQINWKVVDRIVFMAKHKMEIFNSRFKAVGPSQILIRSGINMEKFSIAPNKKNTKKLVFLGHLNFRKGLPILLHFYKQLLKKDPSFYLYIRGEFQDAKLELGARTMIKELSLENNLEFVEWVDDLNAWLADKSHILSFSLEESFHYAVGNGMSAGLKPIIHAWRESREIWPQEFIFSDLDEFLSLALSVEYDPERYRALLVEKGLTGERQVDEIKSLFKDLAKETGLSRFPDE